MRRAVTAVAAVLLFQAAVAQLRAAEPLLGTWRLERQEVNGEKTNSEPLTLRVSQSGDKLAFAFSVPVNNVDFVSMSYTVRLDGTEGDVKNAQGEKIGTIKLSPAGASQYTMTLKGANRPESAGRLTVSSDGKTLTSESDTLQAGRSIHSKQSFSRD
jgi:hypothetical protein